MNEDKLTITLSDRAPVRITKAEWPIIAEGHGPRYRDQVKENDATRKWRLVIRRHADGRMIAYGIFTTQWGDEHDLRAGELLGAEADPVAALRRIAESIGAPEDVVANTVADLPATELA